MRRLVQVPAKISLPIDLVLWRFDSENKCKEYSEYAYKLSNQIDEIHEFARDKLQKSADKMLREYNPNSM